MTPEEMDKKRYAKAKQGMVRMKYYILTPEIIGQAIKHTEESTTAFILTITRLRTPCIGSTGIERNGC